MKPEKILELDPLIHAPMRLAIVSLLAGVKNADFVFIRESTGATDGNLSRHLSKLEDGGYVRTRKSFVKKKPRTTVSLTARGRKAFLKYLEGLAEIVDSKKETGDED